jgi:hypothetical protein
MGFSICVKDLKKKKNQSEGDELVVGLSPTFLNNLQAKKISPLHPVSHINQ